MIRSSSTSRSIPSALGSPGLGSSSLGSTDANLSIQLLAQTFPFYVAIGSNLTIVHIGDALQQLYPHLSIESSLQSQFIIKRPNLPFEFEALRQKSNSLILLECRDDGLRFRGEVIYVEAQHLILLLISPWMTSADSLKTLGLKLSNSELKAAVSDFLFLLKARSATLSETRQLAAKLTKQRTELEQALQQAELATTVLEQAADAIEITDADAQLLYVNSAFERITGYSRDEVFGTTPASLFRAGQHDNAFYEEIWNVVSAGNVWQGTYLGRRKDGSFYHQEATIFPVHNQSGRITNYVAIKRDISDRKQTQTKLEHSLALLRATFEATADGILVIDIQGRVLNYNQKFLDLWQMPESILNSGDFQNVIDFINSCLSDFSCFSARTIFASTLRAMDDRPNQDSREHESREHESRDILKLNDGRILEQYLCPQKLDDMIIGWVWSFRDITEQQRTEAQMRYQALHDSLTGLPNRTLFSERLAIALKNATHHQTQLAVMFLDLDRFKLINDFLGHAAGDQLLSQVSQRIKSCLPGSATLARWAGDEFTLLLPDVESVEDAVVVAQQILDSLKPDYTLDEHVLHVSTSIGIAIYPTDGADSETLLKNADAALYRAKDGGRNGYHIYTSTSNTEASDWLALESQLHRALERQEFVLYYQPQINIVTGEITQMEALLRWNHPELGVVSPNRFIPIAEENGLIVPIGEWVLRTACVQNRLWQIAGLLPVRVAVNLSARQLRQPKLLETIRQVLQDTGLDPRFLELEITETAAMKNVELTKTILGELHQMGVSTAMDDFGTGYSSLSYLKKLPFHTLKIDQSFVRDLTTDANDKAIVAAIIAMGRVLNLRLVAEGVETVVQKHSLLSLDCEEMQGYLFSQPLPADAATKLLNHYRTNLQSRERTMPSLVGEV